MQSETRINPLPKQQPIPIWFGGQADAVLKRATFGNGWIPLGNPGSNSAKALDKINGFLMDAGRDPKQFGIEAWIRFGDGNRTFLSTSEMARTKVQTT